MKTSLHFFSLFSYSLIISVHILFNNIKYKVQDYDFYVTITDGQSNYRR